MSTPVPPGAGTFDALVRILRAEGLAGFTKGLGAKVVQTALNAALQLMLKEQVGGAQPVSCCVVSAGPAAARARTVRRASQELCVALRRRCTRPRVPC